MLYAVALTTTATTKSYQHNQNTWFFSKVFFLHFWSHEGYLGCLLQQHVGCWRGEVPCSSGRAGNPSAPSPKPWPVGYGCPKEGDVYMVADNFAQSLHHIYSKNLTKHAREVVYPCLRSSGKPVCFRFQGLGILKRLDFLYDEPRGWRTSGAWRDIY